MASYRRKQRSSWGSVKYDPKRRVGYIRYWAEGEDGYKRRTKTVRGTRTEVDHALAALRLDHSQDVPCPTVGELHDRYWLPRRNSMLEAGDIAPRSHEQAESMYRCHIAPKWADVPADMVSPLELQKWIADLSRNAAKDSIPVLRQILTYAVRFEHITHNPMNESYDLPSVSTIQKRDDGAWDEHGLCEVWHACWGTWIEAEVLLCGFGSCRVAEGLAVCGSDVRRYIVDGVTTAIVAVRGQVDSQGKFTQRTKTKTSTRSVVLAGCPAERLLKLARKAGEDSLVGNGFGEYIRPQRVREVFAKKLEEAGVERHLIKNLRKTWQTIARWKLKIPPEFSEPMMGHSGGGVTAIHYDKPDGEMFAEVLAQAWTKYPFADALPWYK